MYPTCSVPGSERMQVTDDSYRSGVTVVLNQWNQWTELVFPDTIFEFVWASFEGRRRFVNNLRMSWCDAIHPVLLGKPANLLNVHVRTVNRLWDTGHSLKLIFLYTAFFKLSLILLWGNVTAQSHTSSAQLYLVDLCEIIRRANILLSLFSSQSHFNCSLSRKQI